MTSQLSRDEAIFANKVHVLVHVAVTNIQMYMYMYLYTQQNPVYIKFSVYTCKCVNDVYC